MGFVVVLVLVAVVLPALAAYAQRRVARAKRARGERGEHVRVGVFLRGTAAPYPRRWRQGSVHTGAHPVGWDWWDRVRRPVPLAGLSFVRREIGAVPGSAPTQVNVLRLRDPNGAVVELATAEEYEELLLDAIRHQGPAASGVAGTTALPRRRSLLALACVGFGVVWLSVWAYLWFAGETVTGRVTSNDEEWCGVEWTRGAVRHTAAVDCADQRPGDPIELLAMPAPFTGSAADTAYTPGLVAFVGGLALLVPVGVGVARRVARRGEATRPPLLDVPAPAFGAPLPGDLEPPRELGPHELRWSSVAPYLTARARAEAWHDAPRPSRWERLWHGGGPGRRILRGLVTFAVWPLVFGLVASLVLWTAYDSSRVDPATAREIDAVVTEFSGGPPFVPSEVSVRFEPGNKEQEARAASLRSFEEGDRVRVLYDPGAPSRVRLVGDADGAGRGVALLLAALALAASLVLLACGIALRRYASVRRLRRAEPRTVRYAVGRGPVGEFGMLVFAPEGDPAPEAIVPLDDALPGWLPVTGEATVRGTAADGARVLAYVGGREVYPSEAVVVPDDDALLAAWVNGELPDWEDEP